MSKGSWMWGGRRTDEAVRDTVAPHRSKKDRRRWCGGHVGREHQPEIVVHHAYTTGMACHWWARYGRRDGALVVLDPHWRWWCRHAVMCSICKKYLRYDLREECPEWQG